MGIGTVATEFISDLLNDPQILLGVARRVNCLTILASLTLLLLFYTLQAQIDVVWGGQQIASPKFSYIQTIIGGDENRVYALKVRSRSIRSNTRLFL